MPSCAAQGAVSKATKLRVPLRSGVCWAVLFSQHLWGGDALAPLGRGEPDRACPRAGPPGGMAHQVQDSFSFFRRASEQQLVPAKFVSLLQVLPTRPAVPPCTQSAPSAASTWWASAQSQMACTSAPTPSPARTSGTRPWLSLAAAPTPVSGTSGPAPLSCSRRAGLFWRWGSPELCPVAASPEFARGCQTQPLGPCWDCPPSPGSAGSVRTSGEALLLSTVKRSPSSQGCCSAAGLL